MESKKRGNKATDEHVRRSRVKEHNNNAKKGGKNAGTGESKKERTHD